MKLDFLSGEDYLEIIPKPKIDTPYFSGSSIELMEKIRNFCPDINQPYFMDDKLSKYASVIVFLVEKSQEELKKNEDLVSYLWIQGKRKYNIQTGRYSRHCSKRIVELIYKNKNLESEIESFKLILKDVSLDLFYADQNYISRDNSQIFEALDSYIELPEINDNDFVDLKETVLSFCNPRRWDLSSETHDLESKKLYGKMLHELIDEKRSVKKNG